MDANLMGFFLQVAYALGAFALGRVWSKSKDLTARQKAMESGTRAMLKMELCRIHKEATQKGYISYADEAIAEEIYTAYHSLGGNGQGTKMMKDIQKITMKEEENE